MERKGDMREQEKGNHSVTQHSMVWHGASSVLLSDAIVLPLPPSLPLSLSLALHPPSLPIPSRPTPSFSILSSLIALSYTTLIY